jgi:3'-5' exoribonuclease
MRLPRLRDLGPGSEGEAYFLCARKEHRLTRGGEPWLHVVLQDAAGEVPGKIFGTDRDRFDAEFDAGDFVLVRGRAGVFSGRPEILISFVRRVSPDRDRANGFREEDCVRSAPRPIDEMWRELIAGIEAVAEPGLRVLLSRVARDHEALLRVWPAGLTVHHAYRGGLLEHVLQVARVGRSLAAAYGANGDLVFAGALVHDIGKLRELDYEHVASYSREGNLVGHIGLGLQMLREAASGIADLSPDTLGEVEHLIASHHGSRDLGALVEPRSLEAMILAAADDLDAKIHQIRRHMDEDDSDGPFTSYHPRLKRSFLKPTS